MENVSEVEKSALQRKARLQALKEKAKSNEEKVLSFNNFFNAVTIVFLIKAHLFRINQS